MENIRHVLQAEAGANRESEFLPAVAGSVQKLFRLLRVGAEVFGPFPSSSVRASIRSPERFERWPSQYVLGLRPASVHALVPFAPSIIRRGRIATELPDVVARHRRISCRTALGTGRERMDGLFVHDSSGLIFFRSRIFSGRKSADVFQRPPLRNWASWVAG